MPHTMLAHATALAEILLDLSAADLGTAHGRARLTTALRNTLDLVEPGEHDAACPGCITDGHRPGVLRAVGNLAQLLGEAQEHVEYLGQVTTPARELA